MIILNITHLDLGSRENPLRYFTTLYNHTQNDFLLIGAGEFRVSLDEPPEMCLCYHASDTSTKQDKDLVRRPKMIFGLEQKVSVTVFFNLGYSSVGSL